jgi:hypothetical protein
MGVEQLSILFLRRSGTCASQCGMGRDFVSQRCGLSSKAHGVGSIVPALAKTARVGHPQFGKCEYQIEAERVGHPP